MILVAIEVAAVIILCGAGTIIIQKLERSGILARKKPCEFCESDLIDSQAGSVNHQLSIEFYPENQLFAITSFSTDETGEMEELSRDIEVHYCPVCGRKLD